MSTAKAKKTAAEKPRVLSPADLTKEGISLAVHPIASAMQWITTSPAETANISLEWLRENQPDLIPANHEELSAQCEEDEEGGLYIKDLVGFKKIALVTPLCNKIKLGSYATGTVSCTTGVKLWTTLKKIEKSYENVGDMDHVFFEGFSAGGRGSNEVDMNTGS